MTGRKRLADTVRGLPLATLTPQLGYRRCPVDRKRWRRTGSVISVNGQRFYDHIQCRGGFGAIDLVIHATGGSAAEAIRWLAGKPLPVTRETPVAPGAPKPFVPPPPCKRHWPQVRRWLTAERSLNAKLVDSFRQDGRIYADGRRNAVFLCTDASGTLTGAECVGTHRRADGRRFRGMARGSRKAAGGFWTRKTGAATAPVVFLAESAIDALSALSMDSGAPAAIYASTAGICQNLPDWLEAFGPTAVTCGFDADDAGDAAARALMATDPRLSRTRPEGARDWNEILNLHPR